MHEKVLYDEVTFTQAEMAYLQLLWYLRRLLCLSLTMVDRLEDIELNTLAVARRGGPFVEVGLT